jgi:hypothetical protein
MLQLAKDEANPGAWQIASKMKFATGTGEAASQLQVLLPHTDAGPLQ